ncbi:hypothetical protein VARIO8X_60012 [Burkholderiales bacterium 8X]|nr:hypothetical protein VARIO8X_60012 [Burkholderiales bacterium 8X]
MEHRENNPPAPIKKDQPWYLSVPGTVSHVELASIPNQGAVADLVKRGIPPRTPNAINQVMSWCILTGRAELLRRMLLATPLPRYVAIFHQYHDGLRLRDKLPEPEGLALALEYLIDGINRRGVDHGTFHLQLANLSATTLRRMAIQLHYNRNLTSICFDYCQADPTDDPPALLTLILATFAPGSINQALAFTFSSLSGELASSIAWSMGQSKTLKTLALNGRGHYDIGALRVLLEGVESNKTIDTLGLKYLQIRTVGALIAQGVLDLNQDTAAIEAEAASTFFRLITSGRLRRLNLLQAHIHFQEESIAAFRNSQVRAVLIESATGFSREDFDNLSLSTLMRQLESLQLRAFLITENTALFLLNTLPPTQLKTLAFEWTAFHGRALNLLLSICNKMPSLETLQLWQRPGFASTPLQPLNIHSGIHLGSEPIALDAISQLGSLKVLDLTGLAISSPVLDQLLSLIARTPSLEKLKLDNCNLGQAHVDSLCAGLPNTRVQYVSVCGNADLGDHEIARILTCFDTPQLAGFGFFGCKVTATTATLLDERLKTDFQLQYVDGLPNFPDRETFDRINAALARNRAGKNTDAQASRAVDTFLVGRKKEFKEVHHVFSDMLKKNLDGWQAMQQLSAISHTAWNAGALSHQGVHLANEVDGADELDEHAGPSSTSSLASTLRETFAATDLRAILNPVPTNHDQSAQRPSRKRDRPDVDVEERPAEGDEGGKGDEGEPLRKKPRTSQS